MMRWPVGCTVAADLLGRCTPASATTLSSPVPVFKRDCLHIQLVCALQMRSVGCAAGSSARTHLPVVLPMHLLPLHPCHPPQEQRMHGAVHDRDADGCHTDTAGARCEECKCDLWLAAVVSSAAAGRTACPEHAAALAVSPDTCTLLFRHSIEELQRLVFEAAVLFPGCEEYMRSAQQRVRQRLWMRVKSLGPLVEQQQELPVLHCLDVKPGGREPATPVAGGCLPGGLGACRLG